MKPASLFTVLPLGLLAATQPTNALGQEPPRIPHFQEEATAAGLDSSYQGEWQYMVGGGVATFDCDGSGKPSLLVAGGEGTAKFYHNDSPRSGPLHFTQQTSGLELDHVTGAYPIDIDGDGVTDLVLLRVGGNVLMRGLGGCAFTRANELWGFDGGDGWTVSFAATWEKGANWPTLAFGNYIDRTREDEPWGSCTANMLYRPDADHRRFAPALPLTPSYCALSMLFTDWNRSGEAALRVSNDREYYKGGQEQMWHISPGIAPRLYTQAEGWKYLRIWGMGIASTDLNGTGYPAYFLTSMADNKLQVLEAGPEPLKPAYADIAFARGVTAQRPYTGGDVHPSTAWHPQFEDVNNDGRPDLFIAKGNVAKMPDFAKRDPSNLLLQGADGHFTETGEEAGIVSFATGRGAQLVDFNLDGGMDIVLVNRWENVKLWRNTTPDLGHWIQLRPRQDGANRDAIGGWLELRANDRIQLRELTIGGGHASGSLGWRHFGLGAAEHAEIRVLWPDGEAGPWQSVEANGFYVLERGQQPKRWQAP